MIDPVQAAQIAALNSSANAGFVAAPESAFNSRRLITLAGIIAPILLYRAGKKRLALIVLGLFVAEVWFGMSVGGNAWNWKNLRRLNW